MTNYQAEVERRARSCEAYRRSHKIVRLVHADFTGFDDGNDWEPREIETKLEIETTPESFAQTCGDMVQEARDYIEASRVYVDNDVYGTTVYFAY